MRFVQPEQKTCDEYAEFRSTTASLRVSDVGRRRRVIKERGSSGMHTNSQDAQFTINVF